MNKRLQNSFAGARCYYDLDDYLFNQVTKRFVQKQSISAFDFYAIITWKANRAKTKVRKGLKAANLSPSQLIESMCREDDDRNKMLKLINVSGIGIPIASAILTVCYPDSFTVLDYRAWETLLEFRIVSRRTVPNSIEGYFDSYLPICVRLADEMKISLRQFDQDLWGWSQKQSIEELLL